MNSFVFGGSSGIGRAVVEALLQRGHDVTSLSRKPCNLPNVRNEPFDLDRTGSQIAFHLNNILLADGLAVEGEYRQYILDNGLTCGWRKFHNLTKRGCPDLVIISSGIGAYIGNWQWYDDWHYDSKDVRKAGISTLFRINAISKMWVCNELIRAMRRKRSGKIILIGSMVAQRGSHALEIYGASEAALEGYVRSACRHPAKRGVTLSLVECGWVSSPMTADLKPYIRVAIDKELGDMMTAEDMGNAIVEASDIIRAGEIIQIGN